MTHVYVLMHGARGEAGGTVSSVHEQAHTAARAFFLLRTDLELLHNAPSDLRPYDPAVGKLLLYATVGPDFLAVTREEVLP